MKKNEWFIAGTLIIAGLSCLTMSVTGSHYTLNRFLGTLLQICFWAAIPIFISLFVYLILKLYNKINSNRLNKS